MDCVMRLCVLIFPSNFHTNGFYRMKFYCKADNYVRLNIETRRIRSSLMSLNHSNICKCCALAHTRSHHVIEHYRSCFVHSANFEQIFSDLRAMMNVSFAIETNGICMQLVYVIDFKCIIPQSKNCRKVY